MRASARAAFRRPAVTPSSRNDRSCGGRRPGPAVGTAPTAASASVKRSARRAARSWARASRHACHVIAIASGSTSRGAGSNVPGHANRSASTSASHVSDTSPGRIDAASSALVHTRPDERGAGSHLCSVANAASAVPQPSTGTCPGPWAPSTITRAPRPWPHSTSGATGSCTAVADEMALNCSTATRSHGSDSSCASSTSADSTGSATSTTCRWAPASAQRCCQPRRIEGYSLLRITTASPGPSGSDRVTAAAPAVAFMVRAARAGSSPSHAHTSPSASVSRTARSSVSIATGSDSISRRICPARSSSAVVARPNDAWLSMISPGRSANWLAASRSTARR